MPENTKNLRPTKKQKQLLQFIEVFIAEHGYSPSYREIMHGCSYNSVATVALHINNLIARGHLKKRDNSARSLEVTSSTEQTGKLRTNQVDPGDEKWLVEQVSFRIEQAEQQSEVSSGQLDAIEALLNALKVLGFEEAASSFAGQVKSLKQKVVE